MFAMRFTYQKCWLPDIGVAEVKGEVVLLKILLVSFLTVLLNLFLGHREPD